MVDSDHAGEKANRRPQTGFLIYVNMALITWLSKKKTTIDSSIFGDDFLPMKTGTETLRGLRYKLRIMDVKLTGISYIYGDNMSVINSTKRPESNLNKKNNPILYHAMRESVAMGESINYQIPTIFNLADMLTKTLFGQKQRSMMEGVMNAVFD